MNRSKKEIKPAKTYEQITNNISTKLASDKPEGIDAGDHRSVSQDILDYAKDIKDNIPGTAGIKHVVLNSTTAWGFNDSFLIGNTVLIDKQILIIQIFLVAKRATSNLQIGDMTQVFNGYERGDSGGIPSQGISASHSSGSGNISIQTATEIYVAPSDIRVDPADYSIRVVVLYV